jgi:integrase
MAWPRKLPSGKWQGQYRDPTGQIRSAGTFLRRSDALAAANEQHRRIRRGEWADPALGRTTLAEFADRIMSSRRDLRPASKARDESYLRNHVTPVFGAMSLVRIQRRDIERWIASLADDKGLAPKTVRECHRILGGILAEAVDYNLIPDNPCRPGRHAKYLPRIEAKERRYLTPAEVDALAEAMDDRYSTLVYVGAYLGLRWGELAGLKRPHLNLFRRQMKIVGSLERVDNTYRYVEETKTVNSRRTIPVPTFLVDMLTQHLKDGPDSEYVFPAPKGGFMRYHGWRRRFWNRAVDRAGTEHCTPHALRHTAAAIMIDQEANPVAVQRRLGHKDIRTTLQLYGHLFPEQDDLLTSRLNDLFLSVRSEDLAAHVLHGPDGGNARSTD